MSPTARQWDDVIEAHICGKNLAGAEVTPQPISLEHALKINWFNYSGGFARAIRVVCGIDDCLATRDIVATVVP